MLQISFNPLDRGNLNQMHNPETYNYESDYQCFNPLDRGNLNQIPLPTPTRRLQMKTGFNPLDRGNLNQIAVQLGFTKQEVIVSIP